MTYRIEELISAALEKIKGDKEKDLCKYLPGIEIGHMHHGTLKKIKKARPEELQALLQEFILNQPVPRILDPKPRGFYRTLELNQKDMKLILKLAEQTGDKHLLSKFRPKPSPQRIKKELIRSIKASKVEEELWQAYIQSIEKAENEN